MDQESQSGEKKTHQIPISETEKVTPTVSFDLGIHKPTTQFSAHNATKNHTSSHIAHFPPNSVGARLMNGKKAHSIYQKPAGKISRFWDKFWNIFEWLVTSAAIFAILFLAVNYESYSALFWNKMSQMNGEVGIPANPYSEQQQAKVMRAAPQSQKPLPIAHNVTEAKKQIPEINLEVAPPDDRIVIPRIAKNVPVVRVSTEKLIKKDWAALENEIQEALRFGVVHFPGTAYPGDDGNVVITGHSSYFAWDPGRFKDVFALLHQVDVGDEVIVYHEQQKYRYKIYDKKVVKPSQVEVLTQKGENRLTLITCTPVGTALNRLVLLAKPI